MATPESSDVGIVDYYSRCDASPVIRIDAQRADSLIYMQELFDRLAKRELQEIELGKSNEIILSKRIRTFTLRLVSSRPRRQVWFTETADRLDVFWHNLAEDWGYCGELLHPLLSSEMPCHQYFEGDSDDVELEIAFKEWRPPLHELV